MAAFEFYQPDTLADALEYLHSYPKQTVILAGGTDFTALLNKGMIVPKRVLDINRIAGLSQLRQAGNNIEIGALIRHAQIKSSPLIKERATALADACAHVGSPQIRNQATVVGNIANASPAADSAPALLVLDAQVVLKRVDSSRTAAIAEFFTGPGQTIRQADEIILALILPLQKAYQGSAFYKIGKRNALAISVVSAAVWLLLEEDADTVKGIRLAFGSAASRPVRAYEIEKLALGHKIDDVKRLIGEKISGAIDPIDDIRSSREYRLAVAPVCAARALSMAAERAKKSVEATK